MEFLLGKLKKCCLLNKHILTLQPCILLLKNLSPAFKDMKMILIGEFEFKLDVHAVYNFVIYIQTRNYVLNFYLFLMHI